MNRRRIAGVLVPLFSIRTTRDWGIGGIRDLPAFARWAADYGQKLIQLLPLGELPGNEQSPYSAATSFAIDPMYISVDGVPDLRDEDRLPLLGPDGKNELARAQSSPRVLYGLVRALKARVLRAAFERFRARELDRSTERASAFRAFCEEERAWLDDYAFFRALKQRFGDGWWLDWPVGVRNRDPEVLEEHARELDREILARKYFQWIAHDQWRQSRHEINEMGVELMGDLPFMVGIDSADVWANRNDFQLEATLGVPPDDFSADGQDWGLPAYDWAAMDTNDLTWVRHRAAAMGRLFDRFRVDHLVGYYRQYVRPRTGRSSGFEPLEEAAQIARGEKVLKAIVDSAASVGAKIVAEDLGVIPSFVRASLQKLEIPGYKVMFWERDDATGYRDPAGYPPVSLATSGTHDTEALATWWATMPFDDRRHALSEIPALRPIEKRCDVGAFNDVTHAAILDALYGAGSDLVLLPIQDLLGEPDRVNVPATTGESNWSYRLPKTMEALREDAVAGKKMSTARELVRKHGR